MLKNKIDTETSFKTGWFFGLGLFFAAVAVYLAVVFIGFMTTMMLGYPIWRVFADFI